MNIRPMRVEDVDALQRIHEEFYQDEFDIDVFNQKFLSLFTIENDSGIITLGGIRSLAEVVIVTNKNLSARVRIDGLHEMLSMLAIVGRHNGYDSLHAFIQDKIWLEQLKTAGFQTVNGDAIHYRIT